MKYVKVIPLALAGVSCALATSTGGAGTVGGTGPYPANWTTDSALTNFTIYAPTSPPPSLRLPVLVWGETGCSPNGRVFEAFLTELASHGILVLASGAPDGPQNSPNGVGDAYNPDGSGLKKGIDWISTVAGSGKYSSIDGARIAVAGQSCGGVQAYLQAQDPRISTIGIFNSGQLNASSTVPAQVTKPIFFFLGGSTDIAYANGERDYTAIPAATPKWKGNMDVGHMATYSQPNGGKFGIAAAHWLNWLLRGNTTSSAFFTGSGAGTAAGDGWTAVGAKLDTIKVQTMG